MIPGIIAGAAQGEGAVAPDDPYTQVLVGFNAANNATNFSDEGPYRLPVTAINQAKVTDTQAKFGGTSGTFDGSSDGFTMPWHEGLQFGSGEWTVDAWVRPTSLSSARLIVCVRYGDTAATNSWSLAMAAGGAAELIISDGTTAQNINGGTLTNNAWNHVAADVDATGKARLYLNGVMVASQAGSIAPQDLRRPLNIGCIGTTLNGSWLGQIDEVRILKGLAAYASDAGFTPESAPYTRPATDLVPDADAAFANVVLLLGFDNTNEPYAVTDDSPSHKPLQDRLSESAGSEIISTFASIGGRRCLRTQGNGYAAFADSADWVFGTGPFTVECWFWDDGSGTASLITQRTGGSGAGIISWGINPISDNSIEWLASDGTNTVQFATAAGIYPERTWNHVAVDRDGTGKYRIYVNGKMAASSTSTVQNLRDDSRPLTIGNDSNSGLDFTGYIDELRVTKGTARYASDAGFMPPRKCFSRNEGGVPTWSVDPSITSASGYFDVGDVLTCNPGTSTGRARFGYTYQWRRAGIIIGGATSSTYVLTVDDVGTTITCTVTATNYDGTASATSAAVGPVGVVEYDSDPLAPAGDMQSGTDVLIPSGDMQSGGDALLWRERV